MGVIVIFSYCQSIFGRLYTSPVGETTNRSGMRQDIALHNIRHDQNCRTD